MMELAADVGGLVALNQFKLSGEDSHVVVADQSPFVLLRK
jgi:hypothetical protein